MTNRSAVTAVIVLISQIVILSACNTTAGAGKDIKSAGSAIEKSADDAKK